MFADQPKPFAWKWDHLFLNLLSLSTWCVLSVRLSAQRASCHSNPSTCRSSRICVEWQQFRMSLYLTQRVGFPELTEYSCGFDPISHRFVITPNYWYRTFDIRSSRMLRMTTSDKLGITVWSKQNLVVFSCDLVLFICWRFAHLLK